MAQQSLTKNDSSLYKQQQEYVTAKKKERRHYFLFSVVGIAGFFVVWQLICTLSIINTKYIPSPVEVMQTFIYKLNTKAPDGNNLLANIWASAQVTVIGFCLAAGIGIPLGLIMGWFTLAHRFVSPVFELIRPVPPIAWIPVIVVLVGVNIQARATIIFLATFVSCVLNSFTGIRLTNEVYINVAKTFGAGNFETFWKVGIPSALPMVFTGARLALGGAWMTLVAAEMLASNAGLGNMLSAGRKLARPDIVVLAMAIIGIIGAIMIFGLDKLEKHMIKWSKRG